ncbi:MAG: NmrA family NAD(P)-binding protein [Cyclobacteriaceae bacterium]|nr:NmrA family NAD(P)-binding protein [Cyclobacteriaceae bacterium]
MTYKILITGATGNIGREVMAALAPLNTKHEIIAAGKDVKSTQHKLESFEGISVRQLDFADSAGFDAALQAVDVVFLLRPPNLADISKFFEPFFESMQRQNVSRVVFLSVQGVEDQPKIPHYKMEQLIKALGLEYVFLRPSYFMQNLSTTLLPDILEQDHIYVPAGKVKFTWVDAVDIGKVAAHILTHFDAFSHQELEITGSEVLGFDEVARQMTGVLGRKITYTSPNLCSFFLKKKKQEVPTPMIFVMIMLHFLPRFQKKRHKLSQVVKEVTGDEPGLLQDFLIREQHLFKN